MNYKEKLEVVQVANAPAADVVKWLEDHALDEEPVWYYEAQGRHVLEYLLFRRKDPSINIALARFGTHLPTLRKLYRSGNKITQIAVLTNTCVGPKSLGLGSERIVGVDDVVELIKNFPRTSDQLAAYLANPHISRDTLEKIVNIRKL